MATITQDMRYRLSLIKYAERFGVTKAAIKYKTNRQYIYRWKRRYDGSIESLRDRSRRPHHHPNQHTPEEIKLIFDMRRRNPNAGLVVFWVKLKQRGYSRSIPGLYRFLRKQGIMAVHPPNPKYIPKPYGIWVNKKSGNDRRIYNTVKCHSRIGKILFYLKKDSNKPHKAIIPLSFNTNSTKVCDVILKNIPCP